MICGYNVEIFRLKNDFDSFIRLYFCIGVFELFVDKFYFKIFEYFIWNNVIFIDEVCYEMVDWFIVNINWGFIL